MQQLKCINYLFDLNQTGDDIGNIVIAKIIFRIWTSGIYIRSKCMSEHINNEDLRNKMKDGVLKHCIRRPCA